ncbi:MAG: hypothetical protein SGI83_09240 [Bacteroidota bacterium]|nr:hypothetical protein [Bacteroidota bacterium]
MIRNYSATASKRLALKSILDNIEYKKKCKYLQQIIAMGKKNDVWTQALKVFFDTPYKSYSFRYQCKN